MQRHVLTKKKITFIHIYMYVEKPGRSGGT